MSSFDNLALAYDNSIDWDARLNRELPFLLKHLSQKGSTSILDIACGSGRHSIALAEKSNTVTGFDTSQSMIAAARELAKRKGVSVDFLKADMLNFLEKIDVGFDLVICLGNSLALLPSFEDVTQVFEQVYTLLDSKGTFVFQVLNFEEILHSGFRFFPMKTGQTPTGQEVIFSRFFDHSSANNRSLLVLTSYVKNTNGWVAHVQHQTVLHLNYKWLTKELTKAGFSRFELFSDYSESPFVPDSHRSLIIRSRK
jgi:SAM-dependent methyltransferase